MSCWGSVYQRCQWIRSSETKIKSDMKVKTQINSYLLFEDWYFLKSRFSFSFNCNQIEFVKGQLQNLEITSLLNLIAVPIVYLMMHITHTYKHLFFCCHRSCTYDLSRPLVDLLYNNEGSHIGLSASGAFWQPYFRKADFLLLLLWSCK